MDNITLQTYLAPNFCMDFEKDIIKNYVQKHTSANDSPKEKAIKLYYTIRDEFFYNPYRVSFLPKDYQASHFLENRTEGHCIDKANLLAACARAVGVPSRLGFANVCNHIGTERLEKQLGTNILVFHGYTELFLEGKWVKATPAFNAALCEKLKVKALEFDGQNDSVFQAYSEKGDKFMEYLHDYGTFDEVPFELMFGEWQKYYPNAKVNGNEVMNFS